MGRVCNLLIADAGVEQAIVIESRLRTLGKPHHCHRVPTGLLALHFLQKTPPYQNAPRPDIILLNLDLPGRLGSSVLRRIKSDPDLRSIPVIIVSDFPDRDQVHSYYDQHANAVVRKGIDIDSAVQLLCAIEQFWLETAELPSSSPYS